MSTRKHLGKLILAAIFLIFPVTVWAQSQVIKVKPQIPLPFVDLNAQGEIENLDVYARGVYRLVIGLAAIFAVIMMIVAGYQWILAGGGERTAAAKKRIFGAAIGLMLALLSYVILNAITPELVKLRFKSIQSVATVFSSLDDNFCQDSPDIKKFAENNFVDLHKVQVVPLLGANRIGTAVDLGGAECGKKYQSTDGKISCTGSFCTYTSERCIDGKYCLPVYLYGDISWGIAAGDLTNLFSNSYIDKISLHSICSSRELNSENYEQGIDKKVLTNSTSYNFSNKRTVRESDGVDLETSLDFSRPTELCEKEGGTFYGFALQVEVNDDSGFWSNFGPTIDDNFVVGKNCGRPLSDTDGNIGWSTIDWTKISNLQQKLFQPSDFQGKNGVRCNFEIKREFFPSVDQ